MTWIQRQGNKFGSKSTEYNGEIYHSKKESGRAQELDLLAGAGEIRDIKRQVRISFDICKKCLRLCSEHCRLHHDNGVHHLSNYYIDFTYWDIRYGVRVYEEVKGFETQTWKDKWKLLTILYEDDETKKLLVTK